MKPKPKTNESMPNIGLLNQSLEEIPEDAQQSILGSIDKSKKKDKDDVNLSTNLKEIENRILLKIKVIFDYFRIIYGCRIATKLIGS